MTYPLVAAGGSTKIDLEGNWNDFWSQIVKDPDTQALLVKVGWIGALIAVSSILTFFWQKRKGRGGQGGGMSSVPVYAFVVGAILSAPGVMIPKILQLLDIALNALSSVGG